MTEMMEFFRETGKRGGKKRAASMTPEQRSASAKKAAAASAKVRSAKAKANKKNRADKESR